MKKLLGIVVLVFLWCNLSFAETFKVGQIIKDKFMLTKKVQVNLSPGEWTVVNNEGWVGPIGIMIRTVGIVRTEKNEIAELIELRHGDLTASYQSYLDAALKEVIFKDKYDGCYSRPEYFLLELYKRGNAFNCMVVRHVDMNKMLNFPDNPDSKANRRFYRRWIEDNKLQMPSIMLQSYHTYFSRRVSDVWYEEVHLINPKFFNGPTPKFHTEEASEYHRLNIKKYPKFEKFMIEWVSKSSENQIEFEKRIKVITTHKLDLSKHLLNIKKKPKNKTEKKLKNNDLVDQIEKLNNLFKSGVLTKEEFEKAKKKILN